MDTVTYYLHFDQQTSILMEGISMDIAGGGVVLFFFFLMIWVVSLLRQGLTSPGWPRTGCVTLVSFKLDTFLFQFLES